MEVTFLGTGGTIPTLTRNTVSVAIRYKSEVVLFDCSEGCQKQIMRSTVSFMKIKKIFITHYHGDHFLGLPGLLQTMGMLGRTEPISIYGPEGTEEIVNNILNTGYYALDYDITPKSLSHGDCVCGNGFKVYAFKLCHTVPTNGYLFQEEERAGKFLVEIAEALGIPKRLYGNLQRGKSVKINGKEITPDVVMGPKRKGLSVAYCTDTTPGWDTKIVKNCTLLIHDATGCESLREKLNEFGHSSAKQAAQNAIECNAKKLALIHYSQRYREVQPLLDEAKTIFENTIAPLDMDTLTLRYREFEV
ncbi:MAG: ribonuclease Z [Thermoplasmata archaeon]